MITSLVATPDGIVARDGLVVDGAVWIDAVSTTEEERSTLAEALGVDLPERVRMRALEPSSRLVVSDDYLLMTYSGIAQAPAEPALPISCILSQERLVTVHAADSVAFEAARAFATQKGNGELPKPHDIFLVLVEGSIDAVADRLQTLGLDIDRMARDVFGTDARRRRSNHRVQRSMKRLGLRGTQIMRVQDSLTSLQRLSLFMEQHRERIAPHIDNQTAMAALRADIHALSEYAEALDGKIEFLLDAMLGMITLDQNDIMMVLSLIAAMFLPATLISSIFGMNFEMMPVLKWHHGFFLSLGAMVSAAVVVALFFRWRRWM